MQGRFWLGAGFPSPPTETTRNSPRDSGGKGRSVSRNQKSAGQAGRMYSISQPAERS